MKKMLASLAMVASYLILARLWLEERLLRKDQDGVALRQAWLALVDYTENRQELETLMNVHRRWLNDKEPTMPQCDGIVERLLARWTQQWIRKPLRSMSKETTDDSSDQR